MIDALIKIGAVIVAAILADSFTKEVTGKHIHEHVYAWWKKLRETIETWLQQNKQQLGIAHVMLVVLDACDKLAVRTKHIADRITLGAYGVDAKENAIEIVQTEVSVEEALKQFPQLAEKPVMIMEA